MSIAAVSYASGPDSTEFKTGLFGVGFCQNEQTLMFPSIEWFRHVTVFDAENGLAVCRVNVKSAARKQTSQLVAVPYSDWGFGEYVIVMRKGLRKSTVRLIIDENGYAILME